MRWLDAFLPELFYGALVSVAVLVVAWALLETWDPHREFIAEARAHADRDVTPVDGGVPQELAKLNDSDDDPADLADLVFAETPDDTDYARTDEWERVTPRILTATDAAEMNVIVAIPDHETGIDWSEVYDDKEL